MGYISLSKEILYVLRHNPKEYGLNFDENGYVEINDLLSVLNKKKYRIKNFKERKFFYGKKY